MKRIAILLCLCLLLAGCTAQSMETSEEASHEEVDITLSDTQSLTPSNLEELLEITNARRRAIVKPEPDTSLAENWVMGELEMPFDTSEIQMNFMATNFNEDEIFTLEQVQHDMDYIFYFYELGYGPYYYFGGKEAFDAAKDAIMADMAALEEIKVADIKESMQNHLAFVRDVHFMVNWDSHITALQGYLSDLAFYQDTEGFLEADSGKRVQSINGRQDFEADMALSVTPEGEIAYRYLVLAETDPTDPVEVVFEDGETLSTNFFSVYAVEGYQESEDTVSLSYVDDIPVINITAMGFNYANDDWQANRFLELAEELKNEPVLIIDLRANGGGNGILPQTWYELYTGALLIPNAYDLFRTDLHNEFEIDRTADDNPDFMYYIPNEVTTYYAGPQTINDSWELQNALPRGVVEHEQLLIVLTSKATASSADTFTDLTFNVENSLVIGSNTSGVIISSATWAMEMPNTKMIGVYGSDLRIYDENHFQEGRGFMPDLWVTGDALEAAVSLAKQRLA